MVMWAPVTKELLEEFSLVPSYSERLVRLRSRLEACNCTNKRHLAPPRAEGRKSLEAPKEDPRSLREMVVYEDIIEEKKPVPSFMTRQISQLVPFPRESWLDSGQRRKYLECLRRYVKGPILDLEKQLFEIHCKMNEASANIKTSDAELQAQFVDWLRFYQELHQRVVAEQKEFLVYACSASLAHPGLTGRFENPQAATYIEELIDGECRRRVRSLPRLFQPLDDPLPLQPPGNWTALDLQWRRERQVLCLGQLPKLMLPSLGSKPYPAADTPVENLYVRRPVVPEPEGATRLNWKLPVLSEDPVARQIAETYDVDVVVSASSLVTLLNNSDNQHRFPWSLPLHVVPASPGRRRYVIVDKALKAKQLLTEQDKKQMLFKRSAELQLFRFPPAQRARSSLPLARPQEGEQRAATAKLRMAPAAAKESDDDALTDDSEGGLAIEAPEVFNEDDCPRSPEPEPPCENADPQLNAPVVTIPLERLGSPEPVLGPGVSPSPASPAKTPKAPEVRAAPLAPNRGYTEEDDPGLYPELKVDRRAWAYALWQFGGKRLLIRYALHGRVRQPANRHSSSGPAELPAFLQVKMEKQPYFGCELLTYEELWKAWVACLLRGFAKIVRVRVNFAIGTMLLVEQESLQQMMAKYPAFKPEGGVHFLYSVLQRMDSLSPGLHLLHHEAREHSCKIFRPTEQGEEDKNSFDLHEHVTAAPREPLFSDWLPLDTRLLHVHHQAYHNLPCLFAVPASDKNAHPFLKGSAAARGRGRGRGKGRGRGDGGGGGGGGGRGRGRGDRGGRGRGEGGGRGDGGGGRGRGRGGDGGGGGGRGRGRGRGDGGSNAAKKKGKAP